MHGKVGKEAKGDPARRDAQVGAPAIGKRTLVDQIADHPAGARASAPGPAERSASGLPQLQLKDVPAEPFAMPDGAAVQRKAAGEAAPDGEPPEHVAARGVAGAGSRLPHLKRIQASFGPHDISGVTAHQGPEARQAAGALGAQAFAFGNAVAFASSPDLHTAAHEAAHVVQQRGSRVQLKGNIDQPGDAYERQADAVADRVVAGQSAEVLLDQLAGGRSAAAAVQRRSEPGALVIATEYLKLNDRAAGDAIMRHLLAITHKWPAVITARCRLLGLRSSQFSETNFRSPHVVPHRNGPSRSKHHY